MSFVIPHMYQLMSYYLIEAVNLIKIDVVYIKTFERSITCIENMLAGKAKAVDELRILAHSFWRQVDRGTSFEHREAHLGGNDNAITWHVELLDSLAKNLLASTVGVYVGSVEKVDSSIIGFLNHSKWLFNVQGPTIPILVTIWHETQTNAGDLFFLRKAIVSMFGLVCDSIFNLREDQSCPNEHIP